MLIKRRFKIFNKIKHIYLVFLLIFTCNALERKLEDTSSFSSEDTSSVFINQNQSQIKVESWNHIAGVGQEYSNLTQSRSSYDISYKKIGSGQQESLEISTILVKKIINWNRQHSNGIKLLFSDNPPKVGQLDKFTLQLKVDHNQLVLPSNSIVFAPYNLDIKEAEAKNGLLNNVTYLNFTLFGRFHDDQQIASILASKIVALPVKANNHDWFSLELNMADFNYYWQQNWQETTVIPKEVKQEDILGMLITAESKNTKTLRHYLSEDLPEDFEEHFIEIPIKIRTSAQFSFNEDM